jgi:hypothetical protein
VRWRDRSSIEAEQNRLQIVDAAPAVSPVECAFKFLFFATGAPVSEFAAEFGITQVIFLFAPIGGLLQ